MSHHHFLEYRFRETTSLITDPVLDTFLTSVYKFFFADCSSRLFAVRVVQYDIFRPAFCRSSFTGHHFVY